MARLQHPGIVGATEFFIEDGIHYLVMPYLDGGSLADRLEVTAAVESVDFVTWFDGHAVKPRSRAAIYPVPAKNFFCLQGVTWQLSTAAALLRSPHVSTWKELHSGDIFRRIAGELRSQNSNR